MDVKLKLEQPADFRETEHVTREAFWNQYAPGCSGAPCLRIIGKCSRI